MIIVRLLDLPCSVRGFTLYCGEDDTYNIYINSRDTVEEQKATIKHEIYHIKNGDFDGGTVSAIESRAHDKIS